MSRDFGFAPNPFHGVCTLATCKPQIRAVAQSGDLILGCGSAANNLSGKMIFVMRIEGKMSFSEYWEHPAFQNKRPSFSSNRARSYGDNIYSHDGQRWVQADSHHSFEGGIVNLANLNRDTGSDNVLWGSDFTYWGGDAIDIPSEFRDFYGEDIFPPGRSHRSRFSNELIAAFSTWFEERTTRGVIGRPAAWD